MKKSTRWSIDKRAFPLESNTPFCLEGITQATIESGLANASERILYIHPLEGERLEFYSHTSYLSNIITQIVFDDTIGELDWYIKFSTLDKEIIIFAELT